MGSPVAESFFENDLAPASTSVTDVGDAASQDIPDVGEESDSEGMGVWPLHNSTFGITTTKTVGVGSFGRRNKTTLLGLPDPSAGYPIVRLRCIGTDIVVHLGKETHGGDDGVGIGACEKEWYPPVTRHRPKTHVRSLNSLLIHKFKPCFHTLFVRRHLRQDLYVTAREQAVRSGPVVRFYEDSWNGERECYSEWY